MRKKVESFFEYLSEAIFSRPWQVLLLMLTLALLFIFQLPKLVFDTSNESFFHPDDPIVVQYHQFLEVFDRDEVAILAIKTPSVFSQDFLRNLKSLHEALEQQTPYLDEVISLINVTSIRGENDTLIVDDLLAHWPPDEAAIEVLKQHVLDHPLYPNLLVSEDATFATLLVRAMAFEVVEEGDVLDGFEEPSAFATESQQRKLTPEQNREFIAAIDKVRQQYQGQNFDTHLMGLMLVSDHLLRTMNAEIPKYTVIAIICIALLLLLLYRRWSGVILPLLVVVLALLSTLGGMAMSGTHFTVFSQVLPSFLLAVGIGNAVHLLTIFFRHFRKTGDKRLSMRKAMGHAGLAMVMTSLTTAGGLLSFSLAELAPIASLGIFGAIGVMVALILTVTVIPAAIAIFPIKPIPEKNASKMNRSIDSLLIRMADAAIHYPWVCIFAFLLVTIVAVYGISQLRFVHNPVNWFYPDHEIRKATELTDQFLKGSMNVELIIDTQQVDGVKSVAFLRKLEAFDFAMNQFATDKIYVGKSISILQTIKLVNQALNEGAASAYALPNSNALIAQELLLYENSGGDNVRRLVDSQFQKLRITLKLPWADAGSYVTFIEGLQQQVLDIFGHQTPFVITGMVTLFTRTAYAAIHSMVTSYLIAIVVISAMMMALLTSVRLGLIAMLPNLFPIVVALGFMGLIGFPLDLSSILVGSIAIGLSVDDTIHFMHHFRRYYNQYNEATVAIHHTLQTSGRAMLFTSIILSTGFFVFISSEMNNLISFGVITGAAIILALLADLLLAPALMILITKNQSMCYCLQRQFLSKL